MKELAHKLRTSQVSSVELVQHYLDRIRAVDSDIRAFLYVDEDGAIAEAKASDERRRRGEPLSPWDGIPIAIKDNICTVGTPTTCASRMLENYYSPFEAEVITRIKQAGMPILGKTNMDEFAMGSSTEFSAFYITRNPHDLTRVPGGSSGGSAAAVAAGEAPWALGTDTGGSIRQPGAFCGVVGLKPTYGRVSRWGLVALASSLDQIGPMARTVADAEILFSIIAGHDNRDSTSWPNAAYRVMDAVPDNLKGISVGVPEEFFAEGLDPEVACSVRQAIKMLENLGAEVKPISLPHNIYSIDTYLTLVTAEASSNLARYDGVRYGLRVEAPDCTTMFKKTRTKGFGPEVKRRIMLGTYVLTASHHEAFYEQARRVRTLIAQDLEQAFSSVDVVVTPTTPTTAFRIGEKQDPLQMYLSDSYTAIANLAGNPALTMPCGIDRKGLPIGLQLIADHFREDLIFTVGRVLEQSLREVEAGGEL
ncbi:MAG: Asp-tRNA(Asn)/Glu-tRNA(Gln) amidotransferase subunit GatA [Firmicutes bacterium]|nr:Asp-tRNA(Asn)/Glu-tRNA(Gln) amidotransferase subunit GatA [Bacillota bacterium]